MNTVLLGLAGLVLTAFAGLSYRQWTDYRRANAGAERSRDTLVAIDTVLSALEEADRGERGFLLTGEPRYLEPYNGALQELPTDLATLNNLLSGTPRAQQDFDRLNALAARKLDELRRTIEVRRSNGLAPAIDLVLAEQTTRTMNSIRALCRQMRTSENANQAQATADREAAAGIALLGTVAGSVVLFFLFAFGLEPFASPNPEAWRRSRLLRYGAAVLAVLAITLLRAALTPLIGAFSFPFTLYFCAVMFAAWFGGFRPAVLAIVLSLLAGSWFFAAPTRSLLVSGHDDQIAMLMVVLVGFGTGLLSRSQRNAVERAMHAENSERTERQRFETTLASIGDAVIATDAGGRVIFANGVACALLGWPEAEVRAKPLDRVFRIVDEVTRQPVENPVARVLSQGSLVAPANHTLLIGRDGVEVPIDHNAAPIRDSQGNVQGTVLVFRDITQRRRTERQLAEQATLLAQAAAEARSQRQRLGLALTAGKMGAYEVDPVEKSVWWSPETYSLFGVNPAEFKPSRDSFAALIHPADRDIFIRYWDEQIAEFQPINHEFRILKPDGKERWISCRGIPRYDDSGSPVFYSGLLLDITERKGAEQVLRQFEKLSAAARLSAAVAHEINNPLSGVTNLIYLAREAPGVPASVSELLGLAEQELERVAHAARQALGFYRESSRAEPIDIPELIESVLKVFSTKIAEKKIRIVRGFLQCAPAYGVRGEIRQVLSNLIANAIEAVEEHGAISLATQPAAFGKEPAIEIIVADDGHGIAAEHLDHIFEPFFTTKAGTGTGLGLWVAKEIVERHHGALEVQPALDDSPRRGATLILTLPTVPVAPAPHPSPDPAKSSERPHPGLPPSDGPGKFA